MHEYIRRNPLSKPGRKSLTGSKLRNKKGASMAIALLYFLICAMVGSVVLAAASANISHVRLEKRNEGNYLAVMSAAQLLKAQLKDCAGEWEADHGEQGGAADAEERMGFKTGMMDRVCSLDDTMAVKQELLRNIYRSYLICLKNDKLQVPKDMAGSEGISLTFELTDDDHGMAPVAVALTVTPDHVVMDSRNSQQLHVTVSADFSIAGKASGQYLMQLTMGGLIHYTLDEEEDTQTDPETGETKTTYSYSSQVIFSPDEPLLSGGHGAGGGSR